MVEATSTKVYLKECHEKVVEWALKMGLDEECYYRYLTEVYRALAGDSGVRKKYQGLLKEADKAVQMSHRNGKDKVWQERYATIFRKQCDFMADLIKFISDNKVIDDETKALAFAQTNFMRHQLYAQQRHLDTILRYADMSDPDIREDYENSRWNHDSMKSTLDSLIRYLEDID